MIYQAWKTFQEYNKTDLVGIMTYPASVWYGFIPLLLFSLFVIVLLSTYFSQRRLTGSGDFFSSFAVSGFFTAIIAITMTMVEGLIDNNTLVIAVVIAIIGVIFLITSRDK